MAADWLLDHHHHLRAGSGDELILAGARKRDGAFEIGLRHVRLAVEREGERFLVEVDHAPTFWLTAEQLEERGFETVESYS